MRERRKNTIEIIKGISYSEEFIEKPVLNPTDSPVVIRPKFTLYPNPVNGVLHIGYNKPIVDYFKVKIYDLIKNKQVYEGEMSVEPFLIDVTAWQTGFYSVVIIDIDNKLLFKSKTEIKN